MKRICIRKNIVCSLLLFGVIQFSGAGWAIGGKEENRVIKGPVGLAHIKSNQLSPIQNSILKPRDNLFSITQLADESYLLAGNNGLLVKVTGHGSDEEIDLETNNDFLSVHATGSGQVLLGADKGALFISKDNLKSWSEVAIDTNEAIFNFIELATGEVVLAGSYGLLMSSKLPYQQWEAVNIPWADFLKEAWKEFGEADPHLYSGCTNQRGELLVVGEFGLALKRDTDGHWNKIHGGSIEPAIYDCQLSNNGENIILVGQQGMVYQTSNGGDTWTAKDIAKGVDLYAVEKFKELFIILGDKKKIYTSLSSLDWVCQRFIGDRPLGWYVDMEVSEKETAIIGSNGGFKVAKTPSLLAAINQLDQSKEFVSCE